VQGAEIKLKLLLKALEKQNFKTFQHSCMRAYEIYELQNKHQNIGLE
jgi:hypothetical protein